MTILPKIVKDWLQETINRLFIKKPQYFKYWTWASSALMIICGIPYVLAQFPELVLPTWAEFLSNKVVTWAAGGVWLMAQLTVKNPVVGQTPEGSAVKVTDEKAMPFTAKKEEQKVDEAVPPPPVVDVPKPGDAVDGTGGGSGTE